MVRKRSKSAGPDALEVNLENVPSMLVADLKAALKDRGLQITGKKAELAARLTEALSASGATATPDQEEDVAEESPSNSRRTPSTSARRNAEAKSPPVKTDSPVTRKKSPTRASTRRSASPNKKTTETVEKVASPVPEIKTDEQPVVTEIPEVVEPIVEEPESPVVPEPVQPVVAAEELPEETTSIPEITIEPEVIESEEEGAFPATETAVPPSQEPGTKVSPLTTSPVLTAVRPPPMKPDTPAVKSLMSKKYAARLEAVKRGRDPSPEPEDSNKRQKNDATLGCSIRVSNFAQPISTLKFKNILETFGNLKVFEENPNKSGAFVTYETSDEAAKAKLSLSGMEFEGAQLTCSFTADRRKEETIALTSLVRSTSLKDIDHLFRKTTATPQIYYLPAPVRRRSNSSSRRRSRSPQYRRRSRSPYRNHGYHQRGNHGRR